jgi:hypothetical protein
MKDTHTQILPIHTCPPVSSNVAMGNHQLRGDFQARAGYDDTGGYADLRYPLDLVGLVGYPMVPGEEHTLAQGGASFGVGARVNPFVQK